MNVSVNINMVTTAFELPGYRVVKNLGTKWPGLKVYPARLLTLGRKIRIANCGLEKTFG